MLEKEILIRMGHALEFFYADLRPPPLPGPDPPGTGTPLGPDPPEQASPSLWTDTHV